MDAPLKNPPRGSQGQKLSGVFFFVMLREDAHPLLWTVRDISKKNYKDGGQNRGKYVRVRKQLIKEFSYSSTGGGKAYISTCEKTFLPLNSCHSS